MTKFAVKSAFLFAISLFIFSLATRDVLAAEVDVTATSPNGWAFDVNSANGIGQFVTGPAGQPLGVGSARLFTGTNGNQATAIHKNSYAGTQLMNISKIEYSTYSQSSGSTASLYPLIVLNIDTGTAQIGGDTLTFDPNDQIQDTVQGNWQDWINAQNGIWKSANSNFGEGTISQYLAYVSNFGSINNVLLANRGTDLEALRLQAGPAGLEDVLDTNVDKFIIGINNSDTTYDFEPTTATNNYAQAFFTGVFGAPAGTDTTITPPLNNNPRFNWPGSPAAGVPADNFSARWEGTFNFTTAKYRFVANTNNKTDTMRIFLDDETTPVVEKTPSDPFALDGTLRNMTAGVHRVKVEFIHTTGLARPQWSFWTTTECRDLTADGKVNSGDQGTLASYYGAFPSFVDQNDDNITNSGDQGIMASRFGQLCPYSN